MLQLMLKPVALQTQQAPFGKHWAARVLTR